MTEYNEKYLDLKKRLSILKIIISSQSSSIDQAVSSLTCIDSLLKLLDERYSDGLYLETIESEVIKLEDKINNERID